MNRSLTIRFIAWVTVLLYFLIALGRETLVYYRHYYQAVLEAIKLMGTTPHEYFVKIVILFVLVIIASLIDARYRS